MSKTLCLCNCDLSLSSKYRTQTENATKRSRRLVQPSNHKPPVFIFYGHGNDTEMIGQDRKPIIDLENAHLLRGWVVYAMACNTAKILGPAVIEAGGLAYIGFDKHFKFIPYTHQIFGKCVNNMAIEMINGRSLGNALQLAKDKFDWYIKEYKEKQKKTNDPQLREIFEKTFKLLMDDKTSLTLLGDPRITVR